MKIPKSIEDRDSLYYDLIKKCTDSQDDRIENYAFLRHYYLFGRSPDEDETPYNKIYPHIDTLSAFLFASETTKFSTHLLADEHEIEYLRVKRINRAVNDAWLDSNADQVVSQALIWSLVYNTMLVKIIVRGSEITPFPVDPGSFGVLREDVPYTDRQEAMVHSYYTTKSQLEMDIAAHPKRDEILEAITASPVSTTQPDGLSRILLSATSPNVTGNVNSTLQADINYIPRVSEELIKMYELWVWNDDENDYQVVTQVDNGITIFDRKNFFLKGEHPFIQFCPNPLYSYYWGASEVAGMTGLQKWRNERVQQIKKLLDLQVKPPTALTGFLGLLEEKNYASFSEGSFLATDGMQTKIERFAPDLPNDLFSVIHEIDASFAERSGLQNILMGKGEAGVRSGRQTTELARLSSARIKKRALVVEDALEKMATLYLKCMQKYDDREFRDDKDNPFIAEQFTHNFVVKVDAHSNSPLFVEDAKSDAAEMLQLGIITKERYIDMVNPPEKEIMRRELKEAEAKAAAAQQAQQQQEAAKQQKEDAQKQKKD